MYLLNYKLQSHRFTIRAGNKELSDLCSQIYPNSRYKGNGDTDTVYTLKVKNKGISDEVYEIFENNKKKYHTNERTDLFSYLEWRITCNALSYLKEFLQLHASAVIKNGKAIMFPAEHGYGKTTLAINLAKKGYHCISDDIILIEPETLRILSFPRSFLIKEEAIESLSKSNIIDKNNGYYCEPEGVLYLNPAMYRSGSRPAAEGKCLAENAKPYAIVELKYNPRLENELKPVSKPQMCMTLLEQSFNIHNYKRKGVSILTRLVKKCKCYSLKTSNMEDAVRLISQI